MQELTTKIAKLSIADNKRLIVIGDIHAHKSYLENLLKKVEFSENDELFLLGDYIERGEKSLDTLHYVMELSKQKNVHTLLGNNDAFIFKIINNPYEFDVEHIYNYVQERVKWHGTNTIVEMCGEIGEKITCIDDFLPALAKIKATYQKEIDYIFSLPTVIDISNFTFVHGGLPDENYENFVNLNPFIFMKNDFFVNKNLNFSKFIIVGHMPSVLYKDIQDFSPHFSLEQKIISIDGGCGIKKSGQLNALIIPNINSTDFSFEKYDEFDKIIAKKSQKAEKPSINITWEKNEVEILEKDEVKTKILHLSSKKIAIIPSDFIFYKDGKSFCYDYCDNKLEVEKGEKLNVIDYKKDFGYIAKKDSTVGWFCE